MSYPDTYAARTLGYTWSYDGPLIGGTALDSNGTRLAVTATFTAIQTYKNHGDYVSQNPDKNDAAHSCIGMPIGS